MHKYSRLLLGADLKLDRHGNKGLLFVPVDCIHSPAVVVPNLGATPGKVIQTSRSLPGHPYSIFDLLDDAIA